MKVDRVDIQVEKSDRLLSNYNLDRVFLERRLVLFPRSRLLKPKRHLSRFQRLNLKGLVAAGTDRAG